MLLEPQKKLPLGFGLGLRPEYYDIILSERPKVDWFEIITENYIEPGGLPLHYLDRFRQDYPLVMHGVSLSIGSSDPLDFNYLQQVKSLAEKIEPKWISDHLCWTGVEGYNSHDLLPLPYTEEALNHVAERIQRVQEFLGRRILIENVSSYLTYQSSEMTEWEFLSQVATKADCLILLDINNIYVSSVNHQFNPHDYLYHIPKPRVFQHHLAGHMAEEDYIIDTHDHPITIDVWKLYAEAVRHFGPVATMIERDDRMPPFNELMDELNYARKISASVMQECVA